MPKIVVGNLRMHYVEAGTGRPLVLIMGLGGDHTSWGFQMRPLAEHYRVLAFDNRGAGQTSGADDACTIRMMADDTLKLLDALGIEAADVVGVSMGGMIAQELALAYPQRVRSLHLGSTLARPDAWSLALGESWRQMRTTLSPEAWLRALHPWMFSPATYRERPDLIEALYQRAIANPYPQSVAGFLRQSEAVAAHDTAERLSEIRCPTLVSVGEDDILVPPRWSRDLADRIRGAELRVVPAAGHLYFLERPDAFNRLCRDFLTRIG